MLVPNLDGADRVLTRMDVVIGWAKTAAGQVRNGAISLAAKRLLRTIAHCVTVCDLRVGLRAAFAAAFR